MAWTAPRTWADGDIVTPTMLNAELRDNLLALSTHSHGGAAGDGTDDLAGMSTVELDDTSDPAAPGASKTVIWAADGKLHQRAGASGVAEEFSKVDHGHTITLKGEQSTTYFEGSSSPYGHIFCSYTDTETTRGVFLQLSRTPHGDGGCIGLIAVASFDNTNNVDNYRLDFRVLRDGVQIAEASSPSSSSGGGVDVEGNSMLLDHIGLAATSTTWKMQVKNTKTSGAGSCGDQNGLMFVAGLYIQEFEHAV